MNYHIGQGDKFDMDALIPIRKISFFQRLVLRVSSVFYLPRVLYTLLTIRQDRNLLHDGVRKLSGRKLAATSSDILFKDVKAAAKHKGVTINDLVTACLASGVKQYFELKGDKQTAEFNLTIPANIRFQHYGSWENVRFENKFAPVPLRVPLKSDVNDSLREVPKVTSQLRHRFIDIYATYMGTYYTCMFMPYVFLNYFLMQQTIPYTMAFSNTPGLLKPIWYEGKKSIKMQYYFIPTGYVGMGLSSLSYVDYFKITLTVDDAIMKDP